MAHTLPRIHAGGAPPERYTLQFKNGRQLRHQDHITLAQFRSDGRLESYWLEASPPSIQRGSGFDESSL